MGFEILSAIGVTIIVGMLARWGYGGGSVSPLNFGSHLQDYSDHSSLDHILHNCICADTQRSNSIHCRVWGWGLPDFTTSSVTLVVANQVSSSTISPNMCRCIISPSLQSKGRPKCSHKRKINHLTQRGQTGGLRSTTGLTTLVIRPTKLFLNLLQVTTALFILFASKVLKN
jgi:hypothetical protein